jgi:RpiB/LacA/LacB family sugar-phosphate isomerase
VKIYIGSDHRGFKFKEQILRILAAGGHDVIDVGVHSDEKSYDYPKIGYAVATRVAADKNSRGMLLCLSGIGQTIIANKVPGVYAALCDTVGLARLSRQHNNANVLVMGAHFVKKTELKKIIQVWLSTEFEGGRHLRRLNQIKRIEKGIALTR